MALSPVERHEGPALRSAKIAFFLLVASLAWMKWPLTIGGLESFPVDLLFLATSALWLVALARKETRVRVDRSFWLLGFYFAAMALSALFSDEPRRSAFKLLTQAYLLALPVLAFNLIRTLADFRRLVMWWIAAAGAVALIGVATLILFPVLGRESLDWPLHFSGTLPPGDYPRLELTFIYPAMLANYLGIALMLVLICERLGWLGRRSALALGAAMVISALFALTPGFGGIMFMLGIWFWWRLRSDRPNLALLSLAAGCSMVGAMIVVASVTPVFHSTAPFDLQLRGVPLTLYPAVRLIVWIAASRNFAASPIVGQGIGTDAVDVPYVFPDGGETVVTDAHNMVLSIAVQCGIVGLAAVAAIIWFVARELSSAARKPSAVLLFGLSLAWLSAFVVEGLVGAFEDSRHLWLLLGLIFSAVRLSEPSPEPAQPRS